MKEKTKIITIGETRYQIRKLAADSGSYIFARAMSVANKAASEAPQDQNGDAPSKTPSPEEMARIVAVGFIFRGEDFAMHKFAQKYTLAACSRLERHENSPQDQPFRVADDNGNIIIPEVKEDVSLVMKLEVEVLTFSFTDFFSTGDLSALVGTQATSA
jgi:hypothetical protein